MNSNFQVAPNHYKTTASTVKPLNASRTQLWPRKSEKHTKRTKQFQRVETYKHAKLARGKYTFFALQTDAAFWILTAHVRGPNNAKQKRQINNLKESVFGRAACRWNMQIRPWTSADKAAARLNGGENPARSTECGTWQWFVSILS